MKYVVLSHFDERMGPKVYYTLPKNASHEETDQIPLLMDLYDHGFFIHIFGDLRSANYIFDIPSNLARGRNEMLLISILLPQTDLDTEFLKNLLDQFVQELKNIPDVHKAFHDSEEKHAELIEHLKEFYDSIPEETRLHKRRTTKVFVFGPAGAGKQTIIEELKNIIAQRKIQGNQYDLSDLLIDDLSIMKYDISGKESFGDFWVDKLKDQDGLVFILDSKDKSLYKQAKINLHKIANISVVEHLPLLIIFNKSDLDDEDLREINKYLEINTLPQENIKYFVTADITSDEIGRAFSWLSKQISKRVPISPWARIGALLALWNEPVGLEMLSVYPNDLFEELEETAIRILNVSKSVFGEERLKKSFFTLPFAKLNMSASIFTDYVEDSESPEQKYPLLLAIFYEDKIPIEIITKFNEFIRLKLAKIRTFYSDGPNVENALKSIYTHISKKMTNMKSTVKALLSAEHRYQTLFEGARDAIVLFDYKTGIIIDANKQVEKILDRPLEDIIGIHPTEIQTQEEYDKFRMLFLMQISTEDALPAVLNMNFLDGRSIPVELIANKVQVGGQHLVQCNFRDITERIKSEKILKKSEALNRALVNAIPDMILRISKEGKIIYFKPSNSLRSKLKQTKFENKNIYEVLSKKMAQITADYIERTLETRATQVFTFVFSINNKQQKFEANMVPYATNEVLLIVRDTGEHNKGK
ncbi:MAG: PAS domain S-box protein [Candidatus Lokiarchaeota archaeon]|nr:PAS domain S-box protein [Candidatus Lokiarchaeota archaeon]